MLIDAAGRCAAGVHAHANARTHVIVSVRFMGIRRV
jgi:hypothetical protein